MLAETQRPGTVAQSVEVDFDSVEQRDPWVVEWRFLRIDDVAALERAAAAAGEDQRDVVVLWALPSELPLP